MRAELCTFGLSRHVPLALGFLKAYALGSPDLAGRLELGISDLRSPADKDAWLARARVLRPEVVGFSCYVWNVTRSLALAREVRAALPGCWIVLGGPEVGPRAEEVLRENPEIDAVAVGEGEAAFADVLRARLDGRALAGLAGFAFRGAEGPALGPSRPPIADVDSIPSPYRTGILPLEAGGIPCLETHRGCGFACHFCFYHKSYGPTRDFSLERVRAELEVITRRSPCGLVYLMDPTFNEKRERAKAVCRTIIEGGFRRKFHAEVRAELLDEELVLLMKRAGVTYLEVGLQSASRDVLIGVRRGFREDPFLAGVRMLNEHGFKYVLHLIFGLPGEGFEGFLASLRYAARLKPPLLQVFLLELLPGTELRLRSAELGIEYRKKPYYLMTRNREMDEAAVLRGRWVGAAAELFYNRLPGLWPGLSAESGLDLVGLSLAFADWARARGREAYDPADYFFLIDDVMALEFLRDFGGSRGLGARFGADVARAELERKTIYHEIFDPDSVGEPVA